MDGMDSMFDKEKSEERIASLAGGVARIRVGAATEVELKDKKLRYVCFCFCFKWGREGGREGGREERIINDMEWMVTRRSGRNE